ncbi:TonB-dependent receptor-like protein [Mucilaginibacter gracilis]|uniref:TonB-dependent receptor-like protein n=1 Tax=Mucilaginibacter gracilis TaxID=423350 RepID=A0A495JB72_9SPHI|nr:TonB-dependent receptor plug domain-containing protein [Mucilaginibacter gracilis]RKR85612.1 TonB-dependent receptor-like protein [Mucilaginibacter gracilis]
MNKFYIFLMLLLPLGALAAPGKTLNPAACTDTGLVKTISAKLNAYDLKFASEKVYLQLDKPYYAAGDDIWFKAYITTGSNHVLSKISGVLNVELINDRDSVQRAFKLPVIAGLAWGDIKLTDSLKEGNYRLRAYTNWMRNAPKPCFFEINIPIANGIINAVFTKASYVYSNLGNQTKVDGTIHYSTIDDKPYIGRDVTYEVKHDSPPSIIKGKGVTNISGDLGFSFLNSTDAQNTAITTHIKIDPKQVVTNVLTVKPAADKVDVQFFPESGSLVNGVRSKVAFKAVGSNGLGTEIKGSVFDDQGKEVAFVTTAHAGMGMFFLTPETGRKYTAKLTYPDGSNGTVNLPLAANDGYVLSVFNNSTAANITVKVALSQSTFQQNQNAEINLVAQCAGNVVYTAQSKLESTVFTTSIAKSRFPTGITQFTLFSAKGEPLNERIVFIQNPEQLSLNVNSTKETYKPREKVNLNVEAKHPDNQPALGAFSIAITDETKVAVNEDDENSILANMLLTSEIKGYIEKPNYYFSDNDKAKTDLDILMLTQGYRRFEWKDVLTDNLPALAFKPEKGLDISGAIKTPGGKPIANGKVILITNMGHMEVMNTVSDEQGRFLFNDLTFADSSKFRLQGRTKKDGDNVVVVLDKIKPPAIGKNKYVTDADVNSTMVTYLKNSKKQYDEFSKYGMTSKTNVLKEVNIKDKKQELRHTDNLNAGNNHEWIVKADKLAQHLRLIDAMVGVPGVTINPITHVASSRTGTMMIVLDGNPMDGVPGQPYTLDDIDISTVASIEVLNLAQSVIYGSRGQGGVLLVTSKQTPEDYADSWGKQEVSADGVLSFKPKGLYKAREFYAPRYDDPKINKSIADLRSTIYWNANIITDKDGKAAVEFFNADNPGTYRAVIEGIDTDGNMVRRVYRYKVE